MPRYKNRKFCTHHHWWVHFTPPPIRLPAHIPFFAGIRKRILFTYIYIYVQCDDNSCDIVKARSRCILAGSVLLKIIDHITCLWSDVARFFQDSYTTSIFFNIKNVHPDWAGSHRKASRIVDSCSRIFVQIFYIYFVELVFLGLPQVLVYRDLGS